MEKEERHQLYYTILEDDDEEEEQPKIVNCYITYIAYYSLSDIVEIYD